MTDYLTCPACQGKGVIPIDETEHPGLAEARRNAEMGGERAKRFLAALERNIAEKAIRDRAGGLSDAAK